MTMVSSIVMAATAAGAGVQMAPAADSGQESQAAWGGAVKARRV